MPVIPVQSFFDAIKQNKINDLKLIHSHQPLISLNLKHPKGGDNLIEHAAMHGRLEILIWLMDECGFSLTEKNASGKNAILYAAMNNQVQVLQEMQTRLGANVIAAQIDKEGFDVVLSALRHGNIDVLDWLYTQKSYSFTDNVSFRRKRTLLNEALKKPNNPSVNWLLSKFSFANLLSKDKISETISLAVMNGHLDIIK